MQIEEQNQAVTSPEIALRVDSSESKRAHGGKRPGAGRKPNMVKRWANQVSRATAGEILASVDQIGMFHDIFRNGPRQLKLQAWIALNDRHLGKPTQAVSVSGALVHAQVRDPFLATLPNEALEEPANGAREQTNS